MANTATFSSFHRRQPGLDDPSPEIPNDNLTDYTSDQMVISHHGTTARPTGPHLAAEHQSNGGSQSSHAVLASQWSAISAVALHCDQLGLASPRVVSLGARLQDYEAVPLEAGLAGIYRPASFRPAPWSGFAYDLATDVFTGYAAGTRILTARGEVEVEKLIPGDAVMTLRSPALLPIAWIGRSISALSAIRIEPGAFGPSSPRRTLCIGQNQAVFLGTAPVSARTLINGTTILETAVESFDFFHIDVGRLEVLLAEGVALASGQRTSMLVG